MDGRNYPWGDVWEEAKCRNGKNRGGETTCMVLSYAGGCSVWGHYQMAGNVWEWCEDRYDNEAYERYRAADLQPPSSGKFRVVRGGSWVLDNEDYFRCAFRNRSRTSAVSVMGFAWQGRLPCEALPLCPLISSLPHATDMPASPRICWVTSG